MLLKTALCPGQQHKNLSLPLPLPPLTSPTHPASPPLHLSLPPSLFPSSITFLKSAPANDRDGKSRPRVSREFTAGLFQLGLNECLWLERRRSQDGSEDGVTPPSRLLMHPSCTGNGAGFVRARKMSQIYFGSPPSSLFPSLAPHPEKKKKKKKGKREKK